MSSAPIGVFDSGVGGLSVLRELRLLLPGEDLVYVADTAFCPYGGRSVGDIVARARVLTDLLLAEGAKLVVVACNTATIAAVETLRAEYPVSFVGMEPAVKPAAARTRTGVVGVLATGAALAGDRFHGLVARHAGTVRVVTQPCPGLVERVEEGDLAGPATRALVESYTGPLLASGADVIVLGCTHYPFLRPLLQEVVGPAVELIDTGAAVARRTERLLARDGLPNERPQRGGVRLLTTGTAADAGPLALLWGGEPDVRTVSSRSG